MKSVHQQRSLYTYMKAGIHNDQFSELSSFACTIDFKIMGINNVFKYRVVVSLE